VTTFLKPNSFIGLSDLRRQMPKYYFGWFLKSSSEIN